MQAIGLLEYNSIAAGIEATDEMMKAAQVDLLFAKVVCPGKFIGLVAGEVAAVKSSIDAGKKTGGMYVVDEFVLPNPHPEIIPAMNAATVIEQYQALGVIETFSVASTIVASDAAAKTGLVNLIEVRLAVGMGGKSFVTMTGEVASVRSAVEAGNAEAGARGFLVKSVVIPHPTRELIEGLV